MNPEALAWEVDQAAAVTDAPLPFTNPKPPVSAHAALTMLVPVHF